MRICSLFTLLAVSAGAAVSDSRNGKIPNRLFLTGMFLAGICRVLEPVSVTKAETVLSFLIPGSAVLCRRRCGLGGGDVKMSVFLFMLWPGWQGIRILQFSLLYSALYGLAGRKGFRPGRIRLGPGMLLGAITFSCGRCWQ